LSNIFWDSFDSLTDDEQTVDDGFKTGVLALRRARIS
jgi:hypothetical protein